MRTSYVTTLGTHLLFVESINPARYIPGLSTVANTNSRRLYPRFGNITEIRDGARSWFHSLQVGVQRQFGSNLTFTANYSLSKSIDTSSFAQGGAVSEGPNPFNRALNRALSDFDVTHNLNGSFLWSLPGFRKASPIVRVFAGGWQVNGIINLQNGNPFSVIDSRDAGLAGIGAPVRADLVGNPFLPADRSRGEIVARYFDTNAFRLPADGTFGTSGRNILRGPGYANVDFSVLKDFKLMEGIALQFRTECFNFLNRPNFNLPVSNLSSPTLGQIISSGSPRILQFALKLKF
ncbi:MAG TPA: hypothetical protein VM120_17985 [Bryobacteraceae bacterium]|nr:hypothetical protein [Bryobacteraceae bacterium]